MPEHLTHASMVSGSDDGRSLVVLGGSDWWVSSSVYKVISKNRVLKWETVESLQAARYGFVAMRLPESLVDCD